MTSESALLSLLTHTYCLKVRIVDQTLSHTSMFSFLESLIFFMTEEFDKFRTSNYKILCLLTFSLIKFKTQFRKLSIKMLMKATSCMTDTDITERGVKVYFLFHVPEIHYFITSSIIAFSVN